jgi:serine/threonine protein kinase
VKAPVIRQRVPPPLSPALEDDTTVNSDRRAGAKAGHPLIGKVLADRFTLTAFLSEGRIAQVFSAAQPTGQPRQVAVMVLLPGFAQDLEVTRRFLRAAEKARRLQHPEIATMFDEETGLSFSARLYKGYGMNQIKIMCFYGVKVGKPEFVATLMG